MLQYNPSISGSLSVTGSLIVTNGMIGTVSGVDVQIFSSSINQVITGIQAATGSQEGRLGSIESFTSSTSARLNSIETTSASVDTLNNTQNSRLSALETTSASVDTLNTTQNTRLTNLEIKTGSLATTGSNTFIGTQTITGSLFISANLVVQGTSSLENITASAVSIGTNIVNLNTANPAIRYAGLVIGDSGSIGSSGSFLYDSVQDEMIFIHRGANTTVTSSVILMGPQTYDSIGSESYLTNNRITKGTGNEHLVDSNISDNGTLVTINSVTSSFSGIVGINNTTPYGNLHLTGIYNGVQNTLNLENNWPNTHRTSLINFWAYYNTTSPLAVIEGGQDESATNAGQIVFKTMDSGATPSERIRISNTGRVGIGTTNPQALLHLRSTINTLRIDANAGFEIFITGSDSANIYHATPNQAIYLNTNGGPLHLGTSNASTLLTISGSSVGIGITNPSYKLDVVGDIHSTSELYLDNGYYLRFKRSSGGLSIQTLGIPTGTDDVRLLTTGDFNLVNGSLTNLMTVKNGGNVGIGTNNPTQALSIYRGGQSNYLVIRGDNNSGYDIAQEFTDGTNAVYSGMMRGSTAITGGYTIWTGGAARLNVLSSGNVGIGVTNPTALLQVRGPNAVGTFFDAQNAGAGGAVFSRINASSSPFNQYVFNNGNVGIGRTPLSQLAVYGGPIQIMQDYPGHQTIIRSVGAAGSFSGQLTITIPEMQGAGLSQGFGGYSCEVYVSGFQGAYCHAWFSGYINNGIVTGEVTILRSNGGWSLSQTVTGTFSQGLIFYIDYPSIVHPTARIIFNKGGDPNIAEYNANNITASFS